MVLTFVILNFVTEYWQLYYKCFEGYYVKIKGISKRDFPNKYIAIENCFLGNSVTKEKLVSCHITFWLF